MQRLSVYPMLIMFMMLCLTLYSCDDSETFGDRIREEEKNLEQYVADKGFIILKDFPKDGLFGDNEYVKLSNGVYLHISDKGDGQIPEVGTRIITIAKGEFLGEGETESFNGFESIIGEVSWPLAFVYDKENFFAEFCFLSEGYVSPLEYVGNNSVVSMIVPFGVGSKYQKNSMKSIYFEKVEFTFER